MIKSEFSLLWTMSVGLSQVEEVAVRIQRELMMGSCFCLWLDAPMGAGKTTFARHLMYSLGLDRRIPVNSPTYTYINEYALPSGLYAHLDMYRAEGEIYWEELGCSDYRDFKGILIEWPEALVDSSFTQPTHRLEITVPHPDVRQYAFYVLSEP
ncbi:MAG: tRNA (adenosine(37)-N6)-threonylcarbamoyltransferase complex ATPase subunit type 1 TsaE [Zetaproteobacteria bacterium]|nr:tRNA (adenosine(37)-N6)-threonylcarbamoyltransferase complex ATPase subunit type 1 TsaE [Zetaproteobacteria bacterium]